MTTFPSLPPPTRPPRPLDPTRTKDRLFARSARNAIIDWIDDSGCTWAATLNPNRGLPLQTELSIVRSAFADADRDLLGPRFHRKDARRRLLGFVFAEHPERNLHFHLALRPGLHASDLELQARVNTLARSWAARVPSGTTDIEPIKTVRGWSSYITKEVYRPDFDFWPSSLWWPEKQRKHELGHSPPH
jgi:hypothetical protein